MRGAWAFRGPRLPEGLFLLALAESQPTEKSPEHGPKVIYDVRYRPRCFVSGLLKSLCKKSVVFEQAERFKTVIKIKRVIWMVASVITTACGIHAPWRKPHTPLTAAWSINLSMDGSTIAGCSGGGIQLNHRERQGRVRVHEPLHGHCRHLVSGI